MKEKKTMTKNEFKYMVGIEDDQQIAGLMLLLGDSEPEDDDWIEVARNWYKASNDQYRNYMEKYHKKMYVSY